MDRTTDIPIDFYDHVAHNIHKEYTETFTIPMEKDNRVAVLVVGRHHKQQIQAANRFDGWPHQLDFSFDLN